MNTSTTATTRALLGLCLAVAGCGFGESGIAPPSNRIFFPAGLAVDPAGKWLYVVNSNSDLRFNAGTVVAVDLNAVANDRDRMLHPEAHPTEAPLGRCTNSVFVQPEGGDPTFCCVDFIDGHILNCDERQYVQDKATVRTGSFGGTIKVQRIGDADRRLFVAIRAEPSLTFIDVKLQGEQIQQMTCATGSTAPNAFCTDDHRIKGMKDVDGTVIPFPEEPHEMTLDDDLQVLYVAHLGSILAGQPIPRAVSLIDLCAPASRPPELNYVLDQAFPFSVALGVRVVTPESPGDPTGTLLATAENTSEIAELVFEHPGAVKCPEQANDRRDLTLAAGRRFNSSAFGTRGGDLRGLELTDGGKRAYVLHHQWAVGGEFNPPSIVEIDRTKDAQGVASNEPLGVVNVCSGPNRLLQHDAGRGLRLFVNCFENGQIYVLDPELLNVESIIELGAGPAELVFAPDDPTVAFVAGFANNNVSVLDLKPGSPTEYRVVQRIGFPRASAIPQ